MKAVVDYAKKALENNKDDSKLQEHYDNVKKLFDGTSTTTNKEEEQKSFTNSPDPKLEEETK